MRLSVNYLQIHLAWWSLGFVDMYGHLLLYIWEIFKIFNKLFGLIFSVPIRTPKMCLLVRLMILHKILTLSSLLFILFPSLPELLPVLSLSSLILSSAWSTLMLNPSIDFLFQFNYCVLKFHDLVMESMGIVS